MSNKEAIEHLSEVIKEQSKIIDKMYLLLCHYASVEEIDNAGILQCIASIVSLKYGGNDE